MTPNSNYRALVVDDEPIARKMLSLTLEEAGFACDAADDGIQALSLAKSRKYDLVVTDLRMPNKHGHSLAIDLLSMEDRPVIMIHTAVDEPRLTEDLLIRGVDDVVYKPTNYAWLGVRAKVLAAKRRVKAASASSNALATDTAASALQTPPREDGNASGAVSAAELERRLSTMSELLPISGTPLEAYRLAADAKATNGRLAAAITRDPALSAEVLRTGNSAHYNRSGNRTVDLEQLIARVGRRRIGELALEASVRSAITTRKIPWLNMELAWRRGVAASLAVDELIKQGKYDNLEQGLFLSALMHPLGRIVLATLFPERHEPLARRARENKEPLRQAENRVFSLSHSAVMAKLLEFWKIPSEVTVPMAAALQSFPLDKNKPERDRMRAELVIVSIVIGRLAVGSWEPWDQVDVPPASILKRLGVRSIEEIIAETRTKVRELANVQGFGCRDLPPSDCNSVAAPSVGYWNPMTDSFDFLAALLRAIGAMPESGTLAAQRVVLANCVDCEPSELAKQLVLRADQKLLVVTTENRREQFAGFGQLLTLPTSVGRLCEMIDDARTQPAVPASAM